MQNCTIVMTQNVFRPSLFLKSTFNFTQSTPDFSRISLKILGLEKYDIFRQLESL